MDNSYGHLAKPIILVWSGDENISYAESIFKDELVKRYGLRNLHQFLDVDAADAYLQRHTNTLNLAPALVVIYDPAKEQEIQQFFKDYRSEKFAKLLVCVCSGCTFPAQVTEYDDGIVLTEEIKNGTLGSTIEQFFGEPLEDCCDPELVVANHQAVSDMRPN